MKKKKRKRASGQFRTQKELDRILAGLHGEVDYTFDHQRNEERRLGPRVLSIAGNSDLFNSLACRDYLYLRNLPILASDSILSLLLPQSVWGRAQNGHGMFCDEQGRQLMFPDATFDNVISGIGTDVLGIHSLEVRSRRQRLLDDLEEFLLRCLETERITLGPQDDRSTNPLGVKFLENVTLDTAGFLKGFILGVLMDNWRERKKTAGHFKVTLRGDPLILGGGESLPVDYERFIQSGLTEQRAADYIHTPEQLEELRRIGILVTGEQTDTKTRPVGVYFRRTAGLGISDDAATVYMGKTHGIDAMYGLFVADAADTYDKYLEHYLSGGNDEKLLRTVVESLGSKGRDIFTSQELHHLIYFSAKDNDPRINISSSHRRLIQIEPGAKKPTFLNHLTYVQGGKPARIPLGYNRYDSKKFYDALGERASILRLEW
ncbi:MAG: hypothetical protein U9P14_03005 [Gemmatimonadota bacterium]|nr:hypothetical protein [Gemmatimonadota bacterium]